VDKIIHLRLLQVHLSSVSGLEQVRVEHTQVFFALFLSFLVIHHRGDLFVPIVLKVLGPTVGKGVHRIELSRNLLVLALELTLSGVEE
jgi:hypothetical protein